MSSSEVTREGLRGARPGRDALLWNQGGRRRGGRGEQAMVPDATFASYYGRPVIKKPVWSELDIGGYLYLGGLAAGSSVLGAGAHLSGRPALARGAKLSALAAIGLSGAALVHDLGRPERFLNMLRVVKPTSPMSVGSWILSAYAPAAGAAALSDVTGAFPRAGVVASVAAAALAPALATYTSVLIADTAVPSWHGAYRELPFVFAGSAMSAAGGMGLLLAPCEENGPARRLAFLGAAVELAASQRVEHVGGITAEPYTTGRPGRLMRTAKAMTAAGVVSGLVLGRRSRVLAALSGATLLAASAVTRFAIFEAGVASAEDPKYTVVPQRERLAREKA